jgi:superfamily I DNA/RNA helicase
MLRIADVIPPAEPTGDFWARELPDRAMSALLDRPDELVRDVLIVDEAQDVASPEYLDVLDLMVDGGLAGGNVMLFGDFERQAIFESGDGRAALRERCPHLSSHRLLANCRNLPRIGYLTNTFSGLDPGYSRFRRTDDGVDPMFLTFESGMDQSALLLDAIQRLRSEGYDLHEIVVLSLVRLASTAETTCDEWLRRVLHPADGSEGRPGLLRYATIHAFKGLEAPAVVLTDLDQGLVPGFQSLLYVGLTRATDRLVALIETHTLRAGLGGFK